MIAAAADLPIGALLAWATMVGVDLVTAPQGLLSRPLVAASVAGWLCGDPAAGLSVGVMLELFALDVLPVGASRYPDYGAAAVGAATLASHLDRWAGIGAGTAVGLALAAVGGWSLQWLRHTNTRALQSSVSAISSGSESAIVRLQWLALLRDIARSFLLALIAIGVAALARSALAAADSGRWLPIAAVAVGTAVAAVTGGAIRSAGHGARLGWLAAGVVVGTCWALFG